MAMQIADEFVGGAIVRRGFTCGDEYLKAGTNLSAEKYLSMGRANRAALVDSDYLAPYPKAPIATPAEFQGPKIPLERFIVGVADKKFNVIEGRLLNEEPVSRQEADKLLKDGVSTSH